MPNAQQIFNKYGLRFGVGILLTIVLQAIFGDRTWVDFAGGSILTCLTVVATYPFEAWVKKRFAQRPSKI